MHQNSVKQLQGKVQMTHHTGYLMKALKAKAAMQLSGLVAGGSSLPHSEVVFENHRIESQNHRGWKRPTESPSPTIHPSPIVLTKPCPTTQCPNVP